MTVRVTVVAVLLIGLAGANRAFAQGPYVSASVIADVVRSSHSHYPGAPDVDGGGEAIGFALRAGTPLGAAWGVEVELVRPGEIEQEIDYGVRPLVDTSLRGVPVTAQDGIPSQLLPEIVRVTGFSYRIRSTERNATLSAALWLRQQLTARFSMSYLGGIAFSRSTFDNEITYAPLIIGQPIPVSLIVPPNGTETIIYGVQPLVGVESRIQMTERAHLLPGLRLQASNGRWIIRPAIGLSWNF